MDPFSKTAAQYDSWPDKKKECLRFSEEWWKSWNATDLQYVTKSDNSRANFIVFLGFLFGSWIKKNLIIWHQYPLHDVNNFFCPSFQLYYKSEIKSLNTFCPAKNKQDCLYQRTLKKNLNEYCSIVKIHLLMNKSKELCCTDWLTVSKNSQAFSTQSNCHNLKSP